MHEGRSIFAKLLDFLPRKAFNHCVTKYNDDFNNKGWRRCAAREAVYKCQRCKRLDCKRNPDDHEIHYFCGVPDNRPVDMRNPRNCKCFWFDGWYAENMH